MKNKSKYSLVVLLAIGTLIFSSHKMVKMPYSDMDGVNKVLQSLGDSGVNHFPKKDINGVSAEVGKDLVLSGISKKPNGKKSKRQSKHFVCTSCHNIVQEDPNFTSIDPQARLLYTNENGLPFLQGTTLYGLVNRTQYYNGDYDKKYGEDVYEARNNIRNAIELCAVGCAQGRSLKPYEMESILSYLWTIELKMKDLQLSDEDRNLINNALTNNTGKDNAIQLIKSKYNQYSPATFLKPPPDRKLGTGLTGVPANGKLIYNNSCLHCHKNGRYSYFFMKDSKMDKKFLARKAGTYSPYSIYQVIRYGTTPFSGRKSYMPHYTQEKMSDQQMADLKAYLDQ